MSKPKKKDDTISTKELLSFTGAPTWNELVSFETNVATSNADVDRLGYVMNPAARGKLKTTPKAANQAVFIWEPNNTVNGYPAFCSLQVPTSQNVCFGNWADLILASWAGVIVTVNPYSLDLQGQIRIVVQMLADNGIRHAASFSVSANSISHAGVLPTATVRLESPGTVAGVYAGVTNSGTFPTASFSGTTVAVEIETDAYQRYLRAFVALGGTSPKFPVAVTVVGTKQIS
jgi:hypothetical protein